MMYTFAFTLGPVTPAVSVPPYGEKR